MAAVADLPLAVEPPLEGLRGPQAAQAAARVEALADTLHHTFAPLADALREAAALARAGAGQELGVLLDELDGWDLPAALQESRAHVQADRAREHLDRAAAAASPGDVVRALFDALQRGDLAELQETLDRELSRAEMTLLSYEDGLLLEPDQWTATAAVADEALSSGLVAWIEALEELSDHCQRGDLEAADRALPLLEEADRRLAAVASLGKGVSDEDRG